jgi:hypothetical protein
MVEIEAETRKKILKKQSGSEDAEGRRAKIQSIPEMA